MGKKRVPDWLNSSLWSSSPSPSSSPFLYAQDDDRHQPKPSPTAEPQVNPPLPVSPPPKPQSQPKDSRNGSNDDNGSPAGPSPEDISRQAQLLVELSKKVVNMRELRRIASQGIPDGAGIRSTVWKLLLGYLPSERALWSSELVKKRSQYKRFKEELLMNPSEITRKLEKSTGFDNDDPKVEGSGLLSRSEIPHGEHPLSLGKSSIWNQFFQDSEIIEQIDRDVMRTHPGMHFFSGDSALAKSNQEALKNILLLFAKLNPGIRYVQGMNEILAPLYYVFRNDPDEENAKPFLSGGLWLAGFRTFCRRLLDLVWKLTTWNRSDRWGANWDGWKRLRFVNGLL